MESNANSPSSSTNKPIGLPTEPRAYSASSFPQYSRPEEIGLISTDSELVVSYDKSQMKFYRPPLRQRGRTFGLDLNVGYKQWKPREEGIGLHRIFLWLLDHKNKPNGSFVTGELRPHFVCWRGILTKIATTPYESRQAWKMAVVRHKNMYFLAEFSPEEPEPTECEPTDADQMERQDLKCFWGFKFEQYMGASSPNGLPCLDSAIDNNNTFNSVVRARLCSHRLLFVGEIDCMHPETNKYLELKTSRFFTSLRQENNFHWFKTAKWWAQSYLLDIERILVGFRDDFGFVRQLVWMETHKLAADPRRGWQPAVCMNFLNAVHSHIKDTIQEDDPKQVYLMQWPPGRNLSS